MTLQKNTRTTKPTQPSFRRPYLGGRPSLLMALEPRILFDGAGAEVVADVVDASAFIPQNSEAPAPASDAAAESSAAQAPAAEAASETTSASSGETVQAEKATSTEAGTATSTATNAATNTETGATQPSNREANQEQAEGQKTESAQSSTPTTGASTSTSSSQAETGTTGNTDSADSTEQDGQKNSEQDKSQAESTEKAQTDPEPLPQNDATGQPISQLVFVDGHIQNAQVLADAAQQATSQGAATEQAGTVGNSSYTVSGNALIITLGENPLTDMQNALDQYRDLESIHVISHGETGELRIGHERINEGNLHNYDELFASLGQALNAEGDLLLYGCNTGAQGEGQAFLDALALLTGADVNASDDASGNLAFGGDWDLEVKTGPIEAIGLLNGQNAAAWAGLLAPKDTDAQIVNDQGYMKGKYVMAGVTDRGTFGANTKVGALPDGYDMRSADIGKDRLGFIADSDKDGWYQGDKADFTGDYFAPGTPAEGFGITIDGKDYNNNTDGLYQITKVSMKASSTEDGASITWVGKVNVGTRDVVEITKVMSIAKDGLFIRQDVTIRNLTTETLKNIYFMNDVDPDNNVSLNKSYATLNTVVSQQGESNGKFTCAKLSMVTAEQNASGAGKSGGTEETGSSVALLAFNKDARVDCGASGGLKVTSAKDVFEKSSGNVGDTNTHPGSTTLGKDSYIAISFKVGDLAAGAKTEPLTYYYNLASDPTDLTGMADDLSTKPGEELSYDLTKNDMGDKPISKINGQDVKPGDSVDVKDKDTGEVVGKVTLKDDKKSISFQADDPAYSGVVALTYTIPGECGDKDVDVTITVNDPPEADNDDVSFRPGKPIDFDPTENDNDKNPGDKAKLTVTEIDGKVVKPGTEVTVKDSTGNEVGKVKVGTDGKTLTFTPKDDTVEEATLEYTVSDGKNGGEDTATITLKVDKPPVTNPDTVTARPDTPITFNPVKDSDHDPEGEPLKITEINGKPVTPGTPITVDGGSVTVDKDNNVTFTPDPVKPPSSGKLPDITYTVTDGGPEGGDKTEKITVTIDAPPETQPDTPTTRPGKPVTFDPVQGSDSDPEGKPLTITQITVGTTPVKPGDPPVEIKDPTGKTIGTVELGPDNKVTFTPTDPDFTGEVPPFTYTVTDGGPGDGVDEKITVTIDGLPETKPDTPHTKPGQPITFDPTGNDNDPENKPLRITQITVGTTPVKPGDPPVEIKDPTGKTIGTVELGPDNKITFTPTDPDYTGEVPPFTYTVTDGGPDGEVDEKITITVDKPAPPTPPPATPPRIHTGVPVPPDPAPAVPAGPSGLPGTGLHILYGGGDRGQGLGGAGLQNQARQWTEENTVSALGDQDMAERMLTPDNSMNLDASWDQLVGTDLRQYIHDTVNHTWEQVERWYGTGTPVAEQMRYAALGGAHDPFNGYVNPQDSAMLENLAQELERILDAPMLDAGADNPFAELENSTRTVQGQLRRADILRREVEQLSRLLD